MAAITLPRSALRPATLLPLAGIVAAGVALRLYDLGAKSLWLDEAFSVWMGAQPLAEAWRYAVQLDQHPPLYYTLLHLWMAFGDGESVVRSFSALWGALTLPVIYLAGARIGGRALGLLAALLLAVAPLHISFAQDARMYTMLTFNASMALLCMLHLLDDPTTREHPLFFDPRRHAKVREEYEERKNSRQVANQETRTGWLPSVLGSRFSVLGADWWWLGFILFTTLTFLSHNTAIFFIIAVGLFTVGAFGIPALARRLKGSASRDDYRLWNWAIGLGAALLLWLPWLPSFLVQSRRVYGEFWIPRPTLRSALETWRDFGSAFGPGGRSLVPLVVIFTALVALGAWRLRRRPAVLALLLLLLVTPFAGELLVSLRRPIFYTRTLIWASVPFYLLLAAGLLQLRFRPLIALAALALVLLNAGSLVGYYRHYEPEGWRDAANWMAPQAQPGDLVLFNAGWVQIPFDYYYRRVGPTVEFHGLPADMFDRGILEPKMTYDDIKRLDQLIAGRRRVWLVYSHNWYTDPQNIIPAHLRSSLQPVKAQEFNGLVIFLFRRS
jgi:mannosyltransferase